MTRSGRRRRPRAFWPLSHPFSKHPPQTPRTQQPDAHTRLELTERHALARRRWALKGPRGVSLGLAAECRLLHSAFAPAAPAPAPLHAGEPGVTGAAGGGAGGALVLGVPRQWPRPEVHLSLEHIKPLKLELLGIGLGEGRRGRQGGGGGRVARA